MRSETMVPAKRASDRPPPRRLVTTDAFGARSPVAGAGWETAEGPVPTGFGAVVGATA